MSNFNEYEEIIHPDIIISRPTNYYEEPQSLPAGKARQRSAARYSRKDFENDFHKKPDEDKKAFESYKKSVHFLNPTHLLSHYTTLKNFYNIVETDGLWATHARLSNDDEELRYAQKAIVETINNKKSGFKIGSCDDAYIVSLCYDDDLLSQWRGYCKEHEGVAISFDFGTLRPLYLVCGDKKSCEKKSRPFYHCAQPIIYGRHQLRKFFSTLDAPKIRIISENIFSPYVKHPTFSEEREYRLTATNRPCFDNEYVKYRQSNGVQIPYVEIKSGLPPQALEKYDNIAIRLNIDCEKNYLDKLVNRITASLNRTTASQKCKHHIVKCRDTSESYDDTQCFGCSMRQINIPKRDDTRCGYGREAGISTSKNVIMISEVANRDGLPNQEEVFNIVSEAVDRINEIYLDAKIKVWCEGHLPIRKIRIGNTRRTEEIKESIENFCRNSEYYWLKYVDVTKSNIPFRSPLKFD